MKGGQRIEDEEGSDLPDLAAAREEALRAARPPGGVAILERRDIDMRRFLIADTEAHSVATLNMDEALHGGSLLRLQMEASLRLSQHGHALIWQGDEDQRCAAS